MENTFKELLGTTYDSPSRSKCFLEIHSFVNKFKKKLDERYESWEGICGYVYVIKDIDELLGIIEKLSEDISCIDKFLIEHLVCKFEELKSTARGDDDEFANGGLLSLENAKPQEDMEDLDDDIDQEYLDIVLGKPDALYSPDGERNDSGEVSNAGGKPNQDVVIENEKAGNIQSSTSSSTTLPTTVVDKGEGIKNIQKDYKLGSIFKNIGDTFKDLFEHRSVFEKNSFQEIHVVIDEFKKELDKKNEVGYADKISDAAELLDIIEKKLFLLRYTNIENFLIDHLYCKIRKLESIAKKIDGDDIYIAENK